MGADRWLNSAECAEHFGLKRRDGTPNRRGFMERLAALPSFPAPLTLPDGEKRWKLSEMDEWADEQRRASRAA